MVGKDRERDGTKVGGGVGAQGVGPTLTHLLRRGRGQELGSKWAVLVPTPTLQCLAFPRGRTTEPWQAGVECVAEPKQTHTQEDRQG